MDGKAICTGYENQGICYMCGGALPKRRRAYCCDACRDLYSHLFYWPWAQKDSLARAKWKCQKCGLPLHLVPDIVHPWGWPSGYAVHHKIPINGENRVWHRLNFPSNLKAVCPDCHRIEHKEIRIAAKRCSQEVMELGI